MRQLIAGNWKMNGDLALVASVTAALYARKAAGLACDLIIAPPATLISPAAAALRGLAVIAGQDCHADRAGAHTGDLSAAMLLAAGAGAVILGHSERRADHGETDAAVRAKQGAATAAGLLPIVCVGEHEDVRAAGHAETLVVAQMQASLGDDFTGAIAYEPIWAIGTGRACGPEDVRAMHAALRAALRERFGDRGAAVHLLYGGSVNAGNAAVLLAIPDVNGALVGGASLDPAAFAAIAGLAAKEFAGGGAGA